MHYMPYYPEYAVARLRLHSAHINISQYTLLQKAICIKSAHAAACAEGSCTGSGLYTSVCGRARPTGHINDLPPTG